MTSIISPVLHAKQMAGQARQSLDAATMALVGGDIRPLDPSDFKVGIPEHDGPDTPDNPWFLGRPQPQGSFARAARIAEVAVGHIDRALAYGTGVLSRDVTDAFSRAKEQAVAGVRELTSKTLRPVDPADVKLKFDGAKLWLDMAVNLIDLGRPHPGPVAPPVTTLPVPPADPDLPVLPVKPGRPEFPITILPVNPPVPGRAEPITIQLPSPDSPVQ